MLVLSLELLDKIIWNWNAHCSNTVSGNLTPFKNQQIRLLICPSGAVKCLWLSIFLLYNFRKNFIEVIYFLTIFTDIISWLHSWNNLPLLVCPSIAVKGPHIGPRLTSVRAIPLQKKFQLLQRSELEFWAGGVFLKISSQQFMFMWIRIDQNLNHKYIYLM